MFQIMINPMPMSDKPKREYTHDKDYEIRYGNRKESIERSPSCDGSSKLINEGLTVRQPL